MSFRCGLYLYWKTMFADFDEESCKTATLSLSAVNKNKSNQTLRYKNTKGINSFTSLIQMLVHCGLYL